MKFEYGLWDFRIPTTNLCNFFFDERLISEYTNNEIAFLTNLM